MVTWWRTRPPADPLKTAYEYFCRRIAALGVEREPWEGPAGFAERAAALLPAESDPDPLSGPDPEPLSDPDPLSEPDEPESDFGVAGIVDSLEPEDEPPERLSVL